MEQNNNVKLIIKGTPIRVKYSDSDDFSGDMVRLNSISEVTIKMGDDTLCGSKGSLLDFKEDSECIYDDELCEVIMNEKEEDVKMELSIGTEEIEFCYSLGEIDCDNIFSNLPMELTYANLLNNRVVMNDTITWFGSKKGDRWRDIDSVYSIPNKNSKGEQFWKVIYNR